MSTSLEQKLKQLPSSPGIYFFKGRRGEIIYIGKAARLRNRVRQYFQKSRTLDPKTEALIAEIRSVDWTPLDSEADALFLEAEMVRRYQPRFNILLRDDKSQLFVRIDIKSDYPTVSFLRRPLDDGAEYFGPFLNGFALKKALRYLRRAFPYAISRPTTAKKSGLYYQIGLDPGLEEGHTTLEEYRANLRKLMSYLRGKRVDLVKAIEKDMKAAAGARDFERAAKLRNQLYALRELNRQLLFSDRENLDLSRDEALVMLAKLLNLPEPPRRLECFDISHTQASDTTASMVVFINGATDKSSYRKFKMRAPGNDDFAHMAEVINRRLSSRNTAKWPQPQLIMVDGGKGQLAAAIAARDELGYQHIPMIGLAKRLEEVVMSKGGSSPRFRADLAARTAKAAGGYAKESEGYISVVLPGQTPMIKLLQRVRDESHRFAVSYHNVIKTKRSRQSILDEIPTIGPTTKKKLLRTFGSVRGIEQARKMELERLIGLKKAAILRQYIRADRRRA